MSAPSDLCTAAQVGAWTAVAASDSALVASLISQVSRAALAAIDRTSILPQAVVETRDGNGADRIVLRKWPVVSLASVVVNGSLIPAASALAANVYPTSGYVLESVEQVPPGRSAGVMLRGGSRFWRGLQNVAIAYVAGYQISGEAQTISAAAAAVAQPYGAWASDQGISYAANGQALSLTAGSPAQGQYTLGATPGAYVFNAADNSASVLISYGYVPFDLANAATEWVAELYAYRSRIGQRSKSLGGQETVSFIVGRIPDHVAGMIEPYKRRLLPP